MNDLPMSRAIVFTRTKHGADRLVRRLHDSGIRAEAIHGNKSQSARQRRWRISKRQDVPAGGDGCGFARHRRGRHLARRELRSDRRAGNVCPPHRPHGPGGRSGAAVSFCDPQEMPNLRAIEKLIRRSIPVKTARGGVQYHKAETSVRQAHAPSQSKAIPNQARNPKLEHPPRHFRPQPHPLAGGARHPGQSRRQFSHRRGLRIIHAT